MCSDHASTGVGKELPLSLLGEGFRTVDGPFVVDESGLIFTVRPARYLSIEMAREHVQAHVAAGTTVWIARFCEVVQQSECGSRSMYYVFSALKEAPTQAEVTSEPSSPN